MKTLKIIGEHIDGSLHNVDNLKDHIDSITQHYYEDKNTIVSSWWYLHGGLESEIGFDKGIFCNLEDFNLYIKNCYFNGNKEYFDVVCLEDGIYDVEVIGVDKPCVGYFWITGKEHIPEITNTGFINSNYFNGNKEYFDVVCLEDGIYDVEVIGVDKPCVGYFWITGKEHIPECRGLVCFKDDKEACEYAEQKYNKKAFNL